MPSKRRPSKQRRQARNRAQREALAARSEAAKRAAASAGADSPRSSEATPTRSVRNGEPRRAAVEGGEVGDHSGTPPRGRGLRGRRGRRRPGDLAIMLALAFGLASFVSVFFNDVQVDDRGDPVPAAFGGLALEVRSMLVGDAVEAENAGILSAFGPVVLLWMVPPVAIVAATFWVNRTRPQRSRFLTIAMVLMAVLVMFNPLGTFFLPALIALAVGAFQVRKHELPTRIAEKVAPVKDKDDDVIDVDDVQTDEETALAELERELEEEGEQNTSGNGTRAR